MFLRTVFEAAQQKRNCPELLALTSYTLRAVSARTVRKNWTFDTLKKGKRSGHNHSVLFPVHLHVGVLFSVLLLHNSKRKTYSMLGSDGPGGHRMTLPNPRF